MDFLKFYTMKKKYFSSIFFFALTLICQISLAQISTPVLNGSKTGCPGKIDVWPGDTDNNTFIDNTDLLPIGIFYGTVGIPRDSISNLFQADSSWNWGPALSQSDIKHADCNGDGVINSDDTLAINLNFNLTRPVEISVNPNNNSNIDRTQTLADLYFVTSDSMYDPGDWVDAEVWLGDSLTPVNRLYGIAFTMNLDGSYVVPGSASIDYQPSWLDSIGVNALKFSKFDNTNYTAFGAITRINHLNASGYGKIADLKFQIKNETTLATQLEFSFSGYMANDSAGTTINFNKKTHTIHLNTNVGISELENNSSFGISPNPLNTFATLSFKEYQYNSDLKIIDVVGNIIKQTKFSGKEVNIEKGDMPPGIYFVQIINKEKMFSKKIVIQ